MVVPNNASTGDGELNRAKTVGIDALGLTIINPNTFKLGQNNIKRNTGSEHDAPQNKSSFNLFFRRGTDLKLRLGFLKRRHTDSTLAQAASSVRPTPEEAQKWAESFQDLMNSKYGLSLFRAFLRREFSHENIEFWIAVEEYKKLRRRKLRAKAQKIVSEFVLTHSPQEVNLDLPTKHTLISVISTTQSAPDYTTFDQAQKRIQGILEADAYVRFLKSDLYLDLIHPPDPSGPVTVPEPKVKSSPNRQQS